MATFQNTVTIARPADEVFEFLADFGNTPAWNYAIARTVQTSPGPARVGATYRQTRTVPRRSEEGFEVTIFAPPSRLAVKEQIGPFNATSSYLLEPGGGRDPADQRCRTRALISAAAAVRAARDPESQGSGRAQPRHAETAPGRHPLRSRRRPVVNTLSGGASALAPPLAGCQRIYPTASRRISSRLCGKHRRAPGAHKQAICTCRGLNRGRNPAARNSAFGLPRQPTIKPVRVGDHRGHRTSMKYVKQRMRYAFGQRQRYSAEE